MPAGNGTNPFAGVHATGTAAVAHDTKEAGGLHIYTVSGLAKQYKDWDWKVATAVALAESRGRVDATNKNTDGSIDRGLYQINSVHSQYDAGKLLRDPVYNTDAAHDIWKSAGGFSPWTTYKSGAYKHFLGHDAVVRAKQGGILGTIDDVVSAPFDAAGDAAGAATSGIDAIGDVVSALANPSTWARIGKGTLGGVLVVLGVGGLVFIVANRIPTPVTKTIKTAKAATTGS